MVFKYSSSSPHLYSIPSFKLTSQKKNVKKYQLIAMRLGSINFTAPYIQMLATHKSLMIISGNSCLPARPSLQFSYE